MSVYDQIARRSLREDAEAFFTWLFPDFLREYRFVRVHDARTTPPPDESDRTCDIVVEFVHRSDPNDDCLVNLEFQAEPHVNILERIVVYEIRLRLDLRTEEGQAGKRTVLGLVVNLTGPPQNDILRMTSTLLGSEFEFRARTVTMRDLEAPELLERIEQAELSPNLLVWIPLMRGGDEDDIIQQWLRLAAQVPQSHLRTEYGSMALVLSGLANRETLWQDALKEWNVKESTIVKEWQREAREEGEVLALRADIILVLETRLHSEVPDEVRQRIEGETSLVILRHWLRAAATTESMPDFLAALQSPEE